jgi:hypothetical protein
MALPVESQHKACCDQAGRLMLKYRFKTKPYQHQVKGIKFVFRQWSNGLGAALLFDPRTGKTKTSIDAVSILHLKHNVKRILVICPNRVMGTWVREFHNHCPLHADVILWDAKGRRRALPRNISPYDIQVVVVNFDAFSTPGKRLPSGRRSRKTGLEISLPLLLWTKDIRSSLHQAKRQWPSCLCVTTSSTGCC